MVFLEEAGGGRGNSQWYDSGTFEGYVVRDRGGQLGLEDCVFLEGALTVLTGAQAVRVSENAGPLAESRRSGATSFDDLAGNIFAQDGRVS